MTVGHGQMKVEGNARRRGARAAGIASIMVSALALLGVQSAHALASPLCTFDGKTGTVRVAVNGAVTLSRALDGHILVGGGTCVDPVLVPLIKLDPAATISNTRTVNVVGSVNNDTFTINVVRPLANPTTGNEIRINVDLVLGTDTLVVVGGASADKFLIGTSTGGAFPVGTRLINLNGDGDAEVTSVNVERHTLNGGAGPDRISGSGGPSVGGPFVLPLTLVGGLGDDQLTGGDANDSLQGDAGNDIEQGAQGNDTFNEGLVANGADDLIGGLGTDTTTYKGRSALDPVTVVQNGLGNNDDGSVGEGDDVFTENVVGGAGNDSLTGNAAANVLTGGPGVDVLNGMGGADTLNALDGVGGDTVNGGVDAVADVCKVDVGDIVTNCP